MIVFSKNGDIIYWDMATQSVVNHTKVRMGQLRKNSALNLAKNQIVSFGESGDFYVTNFKNKTEITYNCNHT